MVQYSKDTCVKKKSIARKERRGQSPVQWWWKLAAINLLTYSLKTGWCKKWHLFTIVVVFTFTTCSAPCPLAWCRKRPKREHFRRLLLFLTTKCVDRKGVEKPGKGTQHMQTAIIPRWRKLNSVATKCANLLSCEIRRRESCPFKDDLFIRCDRGATGLGATNLFRLTVSWFSASAILSVLTNFNPINSSQYKAYWFQPNSIMSCHVMSRHA
jgi:hypothetical protein